MRIKNRDALVSHGNIAARTDALEIIETGMSASDPYENTLKLIRLEGDRLTIGNPLFEADGDPNSGYDSYNIHDFEHIYVVGAGKGVQRVAKAIEDVLGDHLTAGHVICKHGDPRIVKTIGVTEGNHPVPDIYCIEGCKEILKIAERVTERDLVFTIILNGGSSLLTLPTEGVPLEDVIELTRLMQIELGAVTFYLNCVRNHIDQLKGGKLARVFSRARLINIAATDINHVDNGAPRDFEYLLRNNRWLHNMPDNSSFQDAEDALRRYGAWERCPKSIREAILRCSPQDDTVKYEEFRHYRARMFGIMPEKKSFYLEALRRARELGYNAQLLTENLNVEAREVGRLLANIADCISRREDVLKRPAALILAGELIVTCGASSGIGGRNQECALAFAEQAEGNGSIVCASVDTDGTDGPGGYRQFGAPNCLSGAIVDGNTAAELRNAGFNLQDALENHATTNVLWNTQNGIYAEQGISLNDLIVVLIRPE